MEEGAGPPLSGNYGYVFAQQTGVLPRAAAPPLRRQVPHRQAPCQASARRLSARLPPGSLRCPANVPACVVPWRGQVPGVRDRTGNPGGARHRPGRTTRARQNHVVGAAPGHNAAIAASAASALQLASARRGQRVPIWRPLLQAEGSRSSAPDVRARNSA
jgi:hypothetical protein